MTQSLTVFYYVIGLFKGSRAHKQVNEGEFCLIKPGKEVFDACVSYFTWHYLSEARSVFLLIALRCWPARGLRRKKGKNNKKKESGSIITICCQGHLPHYKHIHHDQKMFTANWKWSR